MNTTEIRDILENQDWCTPDKFAGVFPSNRLPRPLPIRMQFMIVNLDPSTGPGTHWVAIVLEKKNGGYKGEYFDSYGLAPVVKGRLQAMLARFPQ